MISETPQTPFIVAIDGPAGSGKTTTARELARLLGFVYIDTGAMYRAVALAARQRGLTASDREAICALVMELDIRMETHDGVQCTLLGGRDVEAEIRTQEIARAASDISALGCVRDAMVELQRRVAVGAAGAILEGRDIGTVVFPSAPCKIYLVADVHTRALRRQRQLAEAGTTADLAVIEQEIAERDRNDAARDHSPLRKASDAIEVETTNTTIDEQVLMILTLVRARLDTVEKGRNA
jgi:CMP/dCMP kinase